MIKAIIFDMDGVIIDNQPYQKEAWTQLFKEAGIEVSPQELATKIRGRPTIVGLRNFFGDKFSDEEISKLAKRKEELYISIFEKEFKPVRGFVEFLEDLISNGFLVAVATSSTKGLFEFTVNRLGVSDLFNAVVTSEEVPKSKPEPDIYLRTADKMKVQPQECIVFEDSIPGIDSGRRAGMKVILVKTSHTESEVGKVEKAINDFSEITASDIKSM